MTNLSLFELINGFCFSTDGKTGSGFARLNVRNICVFCFSHGRPHRAPHVRTTLRNILTEPPLPDPKHPPHRPAVWTRTGSRFKEPRKAKPVDGGCRWFGSSATTNGFLRTGPVPDRSEPP